MSFSASGVGSAAGAHFNESRDNILEWYAMTHGWDDKDSVDQAAASRRGKVTARMELQALFKGVKTKDVSYEEKLVIFRHLLDITEDQTLSEDALIGHLLEAYSSLGRQIQGTIQNKLYYFLYGKAMNYGSTINIGEHFRLPAFKDIINDTMRRHPVKGEMQCSPVKGGTYAVVRTVVDASPTGSPVRQAGGSGDYSALPGGPTHPERSVNSRPPQRQGPETPLIPPETTPKKCWFRRMFCFCCD